MMKLGKTALTAVTSYGSAFSLLITSLITIRLATHSLGTEAFGAWSFVFSTIGFFFLFDFGLPSSMARIFGEPMAGRDGREVGRWGSMCFLLLAAQALVMLAAGTLLRNWVLGFSSVQGPLKVEMENLWNALLWIRVISHPASVLPALLFAQNRVYVQNVIYAVSGWLSVAAFYLALEFWHWGLMAYAISIGVSTFSTILFWAVAIWSGPVAVRWSLKGLPWHGFGKMMSFSTSVFASQLAVQATGLTQNIIITSILGLDAAAIFAVTSRLPVFLGTFAFRPFSAFAPRWQEAFCREETKDHWKGEYVSVLRFSGFFAACVATGLLVSNLPFVAWWTKPAFASGGWVNVFLAAGLIIQLYINCSITVFHNYYRLGGLAIARVLAAIGEIGLAIFLAHAIGLAGVPLASVIPGAMLLVYAYRSAGGLMGQPLLRTILADAVWWGPGFALGVLACVANFSNRYFPNPLEAFVVASVVGALLAAPAGLRALQLLWELKQQRAGTPS